jgi:dihydrofolate reductase
MRKLVLLMSVTLDGIIASPRSVSAPDDPDAVRWKVAGLADAGAHIMGRVTYLEMAAHWPTSTEVFAAPMNDVPKVVFSTTLEKADWPESRIAAGDITEEVNALKTEPGGDIIAHGGVTFVQELSRRRLVDEYRLLVQPGVVGAGQPLFADLPEVINLELVEATPFPSGAIGMVYRPRA